jgi:hypothetical protein
MSVELYDEKLLEDGHSLHANTHDLLYCVVSENHPLSQLELDQKLKYHNSAPHWEELEAL